MKHKDLPHVHILDFGPPRDVCLLLRRQFPVPIRRRLLFEVREWQGVPWSAVYIMEDNEEPNLVITEEAAASMPRIISYRGMHPHPRFTLGWRTSALLDVYSCELTDLPRRYKNQIVTRATIDPVLKGWVLLRL